MTSNGQERKRWKLYFDFTKSQDVREEILAGTLGRSSVFETKRSGMELFLTHPKEKWVSAATQMVERFKETGHPVFKSISALTRGILKRKNNRDTIHFNADASNTELLFRTIHSANQLSIYRAVSNWCEEFGQILCSQEVNSLVCATRTEPASGKRLRECLQNLESRSKTSSTYESLLTRIVLAQGRSWHELYNHSGRGRWLWRFHPSMPRIYISSARPRANSAGSKEAQKKRRTSGPLATLFCLLARISTSPFATNPVCGCSRLTSGLFALASFACWGNVVSVETRVLLVTQKIERCLAR